MRTGFRIVKLQEILPVTDFKQRKVDYLARLIGERGSIRNPFYLAGVGRGEFLLLDDASLLEAIRRLEIELIPAQVVPFRKSKKIQADICVGGMKCSFIEDYQKLFPRAFFILNDSPAKWFLDNTIIISISRKNHPDITLGFKRNGTGKISSPFFDFFDFVQSRCTLSNRIDSVETRVTNVKRSTEDYHLTVSNIRGDDILFAARQRYFFPACLLKFEYGCRIMGIDYPLDVLNARASIREKEQFLHDLVNYRLNSGYSNYIKSSVHLLGY
jgi:hypothetical protein